MEENLPKAEDLVSGYWEDILAQAGVSPDFFAQVKRQGPCPICGGKTRAYWRPSNSVKFPETCWCHACGMLNPWTILKHYRGDEPFRDTANFIRSVRGYGNGVTLAQRPLPPRPPVSVPDPAEEAARLENLRSWYQDLWKQARVVTEGDPVHRHLLGRFPALKSIPSVIRYHPNLKYSYYEGNVQKTLGYFPALIAAVQAPDGRCVNIQREYIDPVTFGKLVTPDENSKKAAGVYLQDSYAVRLFDVPDTCDEIALAEGISTALGVNLLYNLPTWSCLSSGGMKKFRVPENMPHIRKIRIYGDNDAPDKLGRRAGNDAAESLKNRLRAEGFIASIIKPKYTNYDFADIAKKLS